jgi:BON domain-containing protein
MRNRFQIAAALVGGLVLLCAAACRPNQTIERQTDDAGIKTSIKAKLASDVRFSTLTAVSVDVTNGVVTLAGPVHNAEEKAKIEETVRAVKGVSGVNNNLQIQPESAAVGAATPVSGAPASGAPPAPAAAATPPAVEPPPTPTP